MAFRRANSFLRSCQKHHFVSPNFIESNLNRTKLTFIKVRLFSKGLFWGVCEANIFALPTNWVVFNQSIYFDSDYVKCHVEATVAHFVLSHFSKLPRGRSNLRFLLATSTKWESREEKIIDIQEFNYRKDYILSYWLMFSRKLMTSGQSLVGIVLIGR